MRCKVYFRADGNAQLGMGHLVRCSALAYMLNEDFDISFFCREIPENQILEFKASGFDCFQIESEDDFFSHITRDTIVVIDGYLYDIAYQQKIKEKGCKLVCIDDLHDKEFIADLIINHAPGISPQDYIAQPYTQFALGLDYALLRPVFLDRAKKTRIIKKIETLLICFGGSDPKRLTEKATEIALEFTQLKKIIVVTGSAYQKNDYLDRLVENNTRIEHRNALSEKEMADVMNQSELAIIPASGILLEAFATKSMVASGFYIDNQKYLYQNCLSLGYIIDCKNFETESIKQALGNALVSNVVVANLIDGKSSVRLNKIFRHLQNEFLFSLRRVIPSDLESTMKWATNSEIRKFSFNQNLISESEHLNWFNSKINDPACFFYILEQDQEKIGSIRFDIKNEEALISYLIDPEYHGKGYGQLIIKKGVEKLIADSLGQLGFTSIVAFVMKVNIPSIKAFERFGFTKTERDETLKFKKEISQCHFQ